MTMTTRIIADAMLVATGVGVLTICLIVGETIVNLIRTRAKKQATTTDTEPQRRI